jgi:hypothetical protein
MPSDAAQTGTAQTGDAQEVARTFADLADSGALDLPVPGSGRTAERFEALAGWGRRDPVLARLAEGHADARAILAELSLTGYEDTPRGQRWGCGRRCPTQSRPGGLAPVGSWTGIGPGARGPAGAPTRWSRRGLRTGRGCSRSRYAGLAWPRWRAPGPPWAWRLATAGRYGSRPSPASPSASRTPMCAGPASGTAPPAWRPAGTAERSASRTPCCGLPGPGRLTGTRWRTSLRRC